MVDHIPSIAKASCYLTCIKHAFKRPQTRTHLYREPCRQTDRHTSMQRTMQPDRQTDTHTHRHLCRELYRQTHRHTHTLMQRTLQTDTHAHRHKHTHTDAYTRTSEGTAVECQYLAGKSKTNTTLVYFSIFI